jgi:hypothetical protein
MANEIKSNNFEEFKRATPWHFFFFYVLDSSGEIISYGYCKAKFYFINKWGFMSANKLHRIIYDKNTLSVVWADFGNLTNIDINKDIEDTEMYISHNSNVYQIVYTLANLWLMKNPDVQRTMLKGLEDDVLDEYIYTICKETINSGHGFILDIEHAKQADITDLLGKGFFKNGPEWKYGKNTKIYDGFEATNIKDILAEKNMFKIVIKNNTYRKTKIKTVSLDIENFILYNEKNKQIILEDYELP